MIQLDTEVEWHLRSETGLMEGRIVPFNEVATVIEDGERYKEGFLPGSLTRLEQVVRQRGNAAFIGLNLDHQEDFANKIGYMRTLVQQADGGWAGFKLYDGPDLPKVRSMLEESHRGLSVFFDDITPPREIDGVRWRTQVNIAHVAATPWGVYAGAKITSLRAEQPPGELATPALDEWASYIATL